MPRWEHADGKFWEVVQTGAQLIVRWGRTGTTGQRRDLGFGSEDAALVEREKQIAKQEALGYVEVLVAAEAMTGSDQGVRWSQRFETANKFVELVLDQRVVQVRRGNRAADDDDDDLVQVAEHSSAAQAREVIDRIVKGLAHDGFKVVREGPPPAEKKAKLASNPELEAQCRAAPDAEAPWAVYADWLIAHEDARGELAALRRNGKETEAESLYKAHRRTWLGGLVKSVRILGWRHGFPIAAGLTVDDKGGLDKVAREFLALPFAQFIEALRFGLAGYSDQNDWRPTLEAVLASPRGPAIRELRFDDYTSEDSEISWTPFGDFSGVWPRLAELRVLTIRSGAGGTLGAIELPELTKFVRESGGLSGAELAAISNARWPALEHLEIWTGAQGYGAEGTVDSLRRILDAKGLPALAHLGIVNCQFSDSLIPALAESKIVRQLRTLDLSKGVMAEQAASALVRNARTFAHLTSIDVSENLLTETELLELRAALPHVISRSQRDYDRDDNNDGDGEDDRYVAVGE